jgi:outer membrane scaffolding protein for murein synthesis (MipA/OmpV family)
MNNSQTAATPTLKQSLAIAAVGAAIAAAFLFLPADVHAQEPPAEGDDWTVVVGAGAIYAPDYEGSKDYEVLPFPYVSVGYKDIAYLRGPEIGVNVIRIKPAEDMKISFGPIARYRRDRTEKRIRTARYRAGVGGAFGRQRRRRRS